MAGPRPLPTIWRFPGWTLALPILSIVLLATSGFAASREESILFSLRQASEKESADERAGFEALRKAFRDTQGPTRSLVALGLGAAYSRRAPSTALQYLSLARTGLASRPEFSPVIAYYSALSKSLLGYHNEGIRIASRALESESLGAGWTRGLQSILLGDLARQRRDAEFLSNYESFVSRFPASKSYQRLALRFARALDRKPLPDEFISALEALSLSYPYSLEASWAFRRLLAMNCDDDPKAKGFVPSREMLVSLGRNANLDEGVRTLVGALLEGKVREKGRGARKLDAVDLAEALNRARLGDHALALAQDELEHARLWKDYALEQRLLPVLARIHYNQQDYLAADRTLSRIRDRYPELYENSKVRELLADNYNRLGSHRLAASEFFLLSERHPANQQFRWQTFWAFYRARLFPEATDQLAVRAEAGSVDREGGADVAYWRARMAGASDVAAGKAALEQVIAKHGDSFYAILASHDLGMPVVPSENRVTQPDNPIRRPRQIQFDPTTPIDDLKLVEILLDVRMVEAARFQMAGIAWDDQDEEESVVLGKFAFSVDNFRAGLSAANRLPRDAGPRPSSLAGLAAARATRPVWRWLYPLAYEQTVDEFGRQAGIDKFFVLSIMRTESHYNPDAQSPVGAQGLMQIMPGTAVRIARLLGDATFNITDLRKPRVSIAYGSYYLEKLLRFYGGNYGLAAAAYNAGPIAVNTWLDACRSCDMAEFVESIPFRETRLYVKSIIKNLVTYRAIYGGQPFTSDDLKMPASLPEGENLF